MRQETLEVPGRVALFGNKNKDSHRKASKTNSQNPSQQESRIGTKSNISDPKRHSVPSQSIHDTGPKYASSIGTSKRETNSKQSSDTPTKKGLNHQGGFSKHLNVLSGRADLKINSVKLGPETTNLAPGYGQYPHSFHMPTNSDIYSVTSEKKTTGFRAPFSQGQPQLKSSILQKGFASPVTEVHEPSGTYTNLH